LFVISAGGRAEAQSGCHDDCVMALGLAVVVMTRMPLPIPPSEPLPAPRVVHYAKHSTLESTGRGRLVKVLGQQALMRRGLRYR